MRPEVPEFSAKNQHYLIAGANPTYYLDTAGTQEEQVAPLSASLQWKKLTPTLLGSWSQTNENATVALYASGTNPTYYGQNFLNTNSIVLSNAVFYIKSVGSPSSNIVAKIYASTGGVGATPTGSFLAISDTVSATPISSSFALTTFPFSGVNKITLSANTEYFVVIEYLGGDSSDYIGVGISSTPATYGNSVSSYTGSSWMALTTGMCFYIYGGVYGLALDGNIVHFVASVDGTYSAYAITDTTHIYGMTISGGAIVDLGYPIGHSVSNVAGKLAIGGGYLFATLGGNDL